jgi:8-oxo-dGTP diphosphatase
MEKFQKIVVTGFVYYENKTLILKRSSKETFLPEYWELPGGKVNFAEDPAEGLVREYKEEAGLEITVGKPFRTFSYISGDGNRHTVEIVYVCNQKSDDVIISEAHSEYAWIGEEDIKNYQISEEMAKSIREGFSISGK